MISDYINNSIDLQIKIKCIEEKKPLGTAGSVLAIFDLLEDEFTVIYGDTILDVNLFKFYEFQKFKI